MSFTLSVVTDEIAQDPAVAIAAAREMGFSHLEFNQVGGCGVHELSDDAVAELGNMAAGAGMGVIAVDPPSFKTVVLDEVPLTEVTRHAEVVEHLEQVRRSCRAARALGAGIVRLFSFRRSSMVGLGNPSPREPLGGPIPDDLLAKIVAGLRAAAAIADQYEVTLGLENVRSCWGNTGHNAARILAAVDHPRLRAIWDPGNDYVSGGVPYPDGYRAVLPYIVHVHVKDAAVVDAATGLTRWACIGTGEVDYGGQLAALRRDRYRGALSVETHWRKPGDSGPESTRDTLAGLRRFLPTAAA